MNERHRKQLAKFFETPTRSDITYREFVNLLLYVGGHEVSGGRTGGSRRRFQIAERRLMLHEPHGKRPLCEGAVEKIRGFFESVGITPELDWEDLD